MTGDTDECRWILCKYIVELQSHPKSDLRCLFLVDVVPEWVIEWERVVNVPAGYQSDQLNSAQMPSIDWTSPLPHGGDVGMLGGSRGILTVRVLDDRLVTSRITSVQSNRLSEHLFDLYQACSSAPRYAQSIQQ